MRRYKRWTREEEDILLELAGYKSFNYIAEKLNRTPYAIQSRLEHLGMSNIKDLSGSLSLSQISSYLNVEPKSVKNWIEKYDLPASRKALRLRIKDKSRLSYSIYPEDFWEWAESHKHLLNFYKIEKGTLLPEPDWFEEERRKDFYLPKRTNRQWTKNEERTLMQMLNANYSYEDISSRLERSIYSIKKKRFLLQKQLSEPSSTKRQWTNEEKDLLIHLRQSNMTYKEIADHLGRTKKSVESMYLKIRSS